MKFKGEVSKLVIGKCNCICEVVIMNSGIEGGGGVIKVGDDGFFMYGCYVVYDV